MKENLWWYLPEHRQKPRPRKGHAQKKIHPDLGIANHPKIIEKRTHFGQWERASHVV
jgi:IS30 family transposase